MHILVGHVIICWFNNNTGVLDGIDVGAIVRTELGAAENGRTRDATAAVRGHMRRHMMEIADVILTVFVHVVGVHTIVQLMRV